MALIYSSFIEGGWLQQGPVETSLPYLRKEIPLPSNIKDDEDVALMISEDTLIALEKVCLFIPCFVTSPVLKLARS